MVVATILAGLNIRGLLPARAVRLNAILINNMDEIYDKEVLQENLERIENMTVKEIRASLPKGYGFLIYGDSHWAILTNEDLISSSK